MCLQTKKYSYIIIVLRKIELIEYTFDNTITYLQLTIMMTK